MAAQEEAQLTDSVHKGTARLTKGGPGAAECRGLTNTLHQVRTRKKREEKPTTHKGPFILRPFLSHTLSTWWNVRTSASPSAGPLTRLHPTRAFRNSVEFLFLGETMCCELSGHQGCSCSRWKSLRLNFPISYYAVCHLLFRHETYRSSCVQRTPY